MKKIIFTLLVFFTTITSSNSNPSLDIGVGAKILDFNWVCSYTKDISYQMWIGLKSIKAEGLMTQSDFNLDEGKYSTPTSILLKRGQEENGETHWVYYNPMLSQNEIRKNTLILKGDEVTLYVQVYFIYNYAEIEKLKVIEEKMWKEINNTKFIRLVKRLTNSIDKLFLIGEKTIMQKSATLEFNCKTSEFILKGGQNN